MLKGMVFGPFVVNCNVPYCSVWLLVYLICALDFLVPLSVFFQSHILTGHTTVDLTVYAHCNAFFWYNERMASESSCNQQRDVYKLQY